MSILISGILVNPAGIPVAGAEITFTALTTSESVLNGFSASIITNDNGEYAIPLEYCDYSISIQSDGHNTVYGAVSITEKSTPTTINELLKLAAMEQTITPAIIVYFREIQSDVTAKLAAVKTLNDSAKDAANSAIAARNDAAQYAQSVNLAVVQAQQASVAAGNAASIAETAAENATETLSYYQQQLVGWQQILTGSGDVTLTAPDGTIVIVRSQQAWDAALDGKLTGLAQTGATDSTPGRILKLADAGTGSFGLGGVTDSLLTEAMADTIGIGRFYSVNAPSSGLSVAMGAHFPHTSSAYGTQLLFRNGRSAFRTKENNVWGSYRELWHSANLIKQTDRFDATAGSMMLNGAWGWGNKGQTFNRDDAATIAWMRASNTGSLIYRNDTADVSYGIRYAPSILLKAGDLFASMSFGHETSTTNPSFGIRATVGNESGTRTVVHNFWTDKNLANPATLNTAQIFTGAKDFSSAVTLRSAANHIKLSCHPSAQVLVVSSDNGIPGIAIGPTDRASTPILDFHSGGYNVGYDTRIISTGGSSSASGGGRLNLLANSLQWNGNAIIDAATTQTITGAKVFTAWPEVRGSTPVLRFQTTSIAESVVGRHVEIGNINGIPRLYMKAGSGGAPISAGEKVLSFPTAASGTILASGNNAVADSNGFWKTASPVVKLFADGTSELTSEAEGITTERLSEGVYRISGCLGLNADLAWGGIEGGISCPKCRNGLERVWNDYDVEADGSIVIRTYHRPHPDAPAFARNEIEGYANGDPIDIPSDTFIAVRVQMPECEEPKPKVMHSNVYCGNTLSVGFR